MQASREFRRDVSCLGEVFDFVAGCLDGWQVAAEEIRRVEFIVEEVFTNFVRHNRGGGAVILVDLLRREGRVVVHLEDREVEPFDPDEVPPPDVAAGLDEREPGGLGLHLVRSLVDDLRYDYDPESRSLGVWATRRVG